MSVSSEGGLCPVCEAWVEDYEPGVSAVKVGGQWMHPACAREALGEAEAQDARQVEDDDEPMSAYEEQREAMRDAEQSAYYGDLGVRS